MKTWPEMPLRLTRWQTSSWRKIKKCFLFYRVPEGELFVWLIQCCLNDRYQCWAAIGLWRIEYSIPGFLCVPSGQRLVVVPSGVTPIASVSITFFHEASPSLGIEDEKSEENVPAAWTRSWMPVLFSKRPGRRDFVCGGDTQ